MNLSAMQYLGGQCAFLFFRCFLFFGVLTFGIVWGRTTTTPTPTATATATATATTTTTTTVATAATAATAATSTTTTTAVAAATATTATTTGTTGTTGTPRTIMKNSNDNVKKNNRRGAVPSPNPPSAPQNLHCISQSMHLLWNHVSKQNSWAEKRKQNSCK